MDWLLALQSVVLGLVEGLTEFLPVSSTGHLIVTSSLLGLPETPATDAMIVVIQAGAILAVCWYYRERLLKILKNLFKAGPERQLAINTIVAFIPAVIVGLLFGGLLKVYLFNAVTVGVMLIVGGLIILWAENRQSPTVRVATMDDLTLKDALGVGLCQCLAMIPGTSRSGATIIGGLLLGLSRRAATEFSFFLAIPTIFGATLYELFMSREALLQTDATLVVLGTIVSFFSALAVVHWLIGFVGRHDFKAFGWYRIAFGLVILLTWATGIVRW